MSDTQWLARFIAAPDELGDAPLLRHEFDIESGHGIIREAMLSVSALGVVEPWLNGEPVAGDLMTPGWSSFEWRLRYATHDLTDRLTTGRSTLGLALGNGWYQGRLGWGAGVTPYAGALSGFAELRVTFADGFVQTVKTDASWSAAASDVTSNSIYDGESIDARKRTAGWSVSGFDDSNWAAVRVEEFDLARLEPYIGPRVTRQDEVRPQKIWTSPAGKVLIDFGQNLVGWARVTTAGTSGDVITVRYAEVLEHDELGTRPLRVALATDRFTLSGALDTFEPTFTFHGFRYAEVTGWPGGIESIAEGAITAVVVSSELKRIGQFRCSDPLLNQLHSNVVWGMRGNFLDVPTDCPQRDERLGWTGDIAAFAPSAAYLFDVKDFLRDWLRDLSLEQEHRDGVVPYVVPDILKYLGIPPEFQPYESTAVWSDAAVWVPMALWGAYGDQTVLEQSFASMASHVRHVSTLLSPNGTWDSGFQFGDWLDPDADPAHAADAKADPGVVATLSIFRSATMVAEAAGVLGKTQEQREFEGMADALRRSFLATYVREHRIFSDCTTVYALAIAFNILDEESRMWAGLRLAELVEASGFTISTGFAGTPFICDALSSTGHVDVAYKLLMQQKNPSWLYPVTMGATTIWERWDSMLPDGTINPGEMTSFNHYALGAVADWMHRVVGGLAPLDPGYSRILVEPMPGGGLDWAESSLDTPHGLARVRWDRIDGNIRVTVTVPEGVTAVVRIGRELELGAGVHEVFAD